MPIRNVLADYADTGGIVVAFNFDWYGPPFGLDGRWMTGGYTPFNYPAPINFTNSCLGNYDMNHPLMQGIPAGSLCAGFRHTMTLSSGAELWGGVGGAVPGQRAVVRLQDQQRANRCRHQRLCG